MAKPSERLMEWLRDAHAMEQQAQTMLSALARRIDDHPEAKERIETHLQQTRTHASMIESCIQRRGGDISTLKDLAARLAAGSRALGGILAGDEIIKSVMASYTFEHMEVAAYRVLVATADQVGDTETSAVCARILREEEEMGRWIYEKLPSLASTYLGREEALDLEAQS